MKNNPFTQSIALSLLVSFLAVSCSDARPARPLTRAQAADAEGLPGAVIEDDSDDVSTSSNDDGNASETISTSTSDSVVRGGGAVDSSAGTADAGDESNGSNEGNADNTGDKPTAETGNNTNSDNGANNNNNNNAGGVDAANGQRLFASIGCNRCHGASGDGDTRNQSATEIVRARTQVGAHRNVNAWPNNDDAADISAFLTR